MEATGCCGTLLHQLEYHNPNWGSDTRIHILNVKDRPRSGRPRITTDKWIVQFAWWLWGIVASLHTAYSLIHALSRTLWQAGVRTDHQEPATCFPVEIPESYPEASPNSWSNNWVHWWPVLPVSCGSLLALRDFGKFLLDPTSLLWAVSFIVIMILGHNSGIWKGMIHL